MEWKNSKAYGVMTIIATAVNVLAELLKSILS